MKTAEVRKKDGTILHGHVADIDFAEKTFYLLAQDQVGMVGRRQGTPLKWEECDYVYYRERNGGVFQPPNFIDQWRVQENHPARPTDFY